MKTSLQHIKHLTDADPILGAAILNLNLPIRKSRKNYFQSLTRAIVGQQLSVKAAATINQRVSDLFKTSKLSTSDFPTPQQFLRMPEARLRSAGLSNAKVSYTKNLARFILEHEDEFKKLSQLADEEIITLLTQIKGIGRWTAEMFLIFTLGREDVFSHGDLGLRNGLMKLYRLRKVPSFKRAEQITKKWKPYRSHGSLYLWASLDQNNNKQ